MGCLKSIAPAMIRRGAVAHIISLCIVLRAGVCRVRIIHKIIRRCNPVLGMPDTVAQACCRLVHVYIRLTLYNDVDILYAASCFRAACPPGLLRIVRISAPVLGINSNAVHKLPLLQPNLVDRCCFVLRLLLRFI